MRIRSPRDLGLLVRERRQELRFTQARLAASVGVSRKWIIDLEAGKRSAELGLVLRTLNVIGLDVDIRPRSAALGSPDAAEFDAILKHGATPTPGRRG